jgi:hypothetical protein
MKTIRVTVLAVDFIPLRETVILDGKCEEGDK